MLCLNLSTPKSAFLSSTTSSAKPHRKKFIISATLSSTPSPQSQNLYQPFRPPPSPLPPKFQSLDTASRLDILSNRLGLWFEFSPLISSLIYEGYTSSSIEEMTGLSSIEQNRITVGAQVRDSLVSSNIDPKYLAFFDNGGAELLYEIRLLNNLQRLAAAKYIVEHNYDVKDARDLARAMKDFPRRRGEKGWDKFSYHLPGDCLSYMFYRQSMENDGSAERINMVKCALEVVESERAKELISEELEVGGKTREGKIDDDDVRVPVVRLKTGEVAETSRVVMLPVCKAEGYEREFVNAPWEIENEGGFGVIAAEKGWNRWVALPGWEPIAGLMKGGVVIAFSDARALPWRANRWYKEEAILVVADRTRKEVVVDEGFYLVAAEDNNGGEGLKVRRGSELKALGVELSLGTVVLVVRPPRDENEDQLADEDWE